ncbi:MAG: DUF1631 family protein [Burkholderiaceae bacterium]|nr:DUF1631 family protein [Burkholderiaceae bacterium]MEB2352882.1 DUF1631 family protein [Burkholderiaceae bacterium]
MSSAISERIHQATGNSREPAVDPRRRFELLEDCRGIVVSGLERVVNEALDRLSDEMVARAMGETRRENQQVLLEAVAVVRQHRRDIEARFRKSFSDVLERRMFRHGGQTAAREVHDAELALVDEAVEEERIALERLAQRARNRLDPDQVLGMRARLAALLDREWFDENDHPASPEEVFEALRVALDTLAPAIGVRAALLQAFEPHVTAGLNSVYSHVNERLRSNRILPTLKPRVVGAAESPSRGESAASGPSPAAAPAPTRLAEAAVAVPVSPDAFAALMQQIAAGQPSARRSAARLLTDPSTFAMADLPIPSAEPPLIEALNALQSMPDVAPGGGATMTELLDQARQKGSALDQVTIEIVSLVFDYIYADRLIPDPVKQQLLRLQVVAMKAALIDRSFFARRQHPMRRLIDRISEAATDPDADVGPQSQLVEGIAGLVDWIIEHFESDLATFDEALRRLDLLMHGEAERRATRLAEITREAERLEALAQAQEAASAEIALRIDPVTPVFVREFLYRWWSRALAHAQVDAAGSDVAWASELHAAELLIWSVAPKTPEEIGRLAAVLPKLISGLMKGLAPVGMEAGERERFFNELLQWHTRAVREAKTAAGGPPASSIAGGPRGDVVPQAPVRAAAAAVPVGGGGSASVGAIDTRPAGQGEACVDALQRGDLVELDDGGARRVFRLAWIGPTRKLFVLTRHPDAGRSFTRSELAHLFEAGFARRAVVESALDRAIDAVAQPEAVRAAA